MRCPSAGRSAGLSSDVSSGLEAARHSATVVRTRCASRASLHAHACASAMYNAAWAAPSTSTTSRGTGPGPGPLRSFRVCPNTAQTNARTAGSLCAGSSSVGSSSSCCTERRASAASTRAAVTAAAASGMLSLELLPDDDDVTPPSEHRLYTASASSVAARSAASVAAAAAALAVNARLSSDSTDSTRRGEGDPSRRQRVPPAFAAVTSHRARICGTTTSCQCLAYLDLVYCCVGSSPSPSRPCRGASPRAGMHFPEHPSNTQHVAAASASTRSGHHSTAKPFVFVANACVKNRAARSAPRAMGMTAAHSASNTPRRASNPWRRLRGAASCDSARRSASSGASRSAGAASAPQGATAAYIWMDSHSILRRVRTCARARGAPISTAVVSAVATALRTEHQCSWTVLSSSPAHAAHAAEYATTRSTATAYAARNAPYSLSRACPRRPIATAALAASACAFAFAFACELALASYAECANDASSSDAAATAPAPPPSAT